MELYFQPMARFEWDAVKARSNARKHGVRFEDALLAFDDPFALAEQDRFEGREPRWQTLGMPETLSFFSWRIQSGMRKGKKSFA